MYSLVKRMVIVGFFVFIYLLVNNGQATYAETIENLPDHWIWPTDGIVTDTYGSRHGHHHGIDIAGTYGAPIYAVDKGVVTKSYYSGSYGHVIFIMHENNLETVYAHLSARHVEEGDTVNQGDIIGLMGSTGRSSGVHLHFEVHENQWTYSKENSIDPSDVLGEIHIGETVEVSLKETDEFIPLIDRMAMASTHEEVSPFLYSDYQLLKGENDESEEAFHIASLSIEEVERLENHLFDPVDEVVYTVEKGDTLWDIAVAFNTTVEAIVVQNQLKSELIQPGQQLIIHKNLLNGYIVQRDDTLTSIARKTNVSIEKIKEINHLQSDIIYPDQILLLEEKKSEESIPPMIKKE